MGKHSWDRTWNGIDVVLVEIRLNNNRNVVLYSVVRYTILNYSSIEKHAILVKVAVKPNVEDSPNVDKVVSQTFLVPFFVKTHVKESVDHFPCSHL